MDLDSFSFQVPINASWAKQSVRLTKHVTSVITIVLVFIVPLEIESGSSSAALGLACGFFFFNFVKDSHSKIAPSPYRHTAVGAGDEAVICHMFRNYKFIAAALAASKGGVRHGACRPFWSALANRLFPASRWIG